jgi:hypothetical protein
VTDAISAVLPPDQRQAFDLARLQYRNVLTLMKPGAVNENTGNVVGSMLANKLKRSDEKGVRLGRTQSDLYNAARFADAFRPIVGNSGTATRSFLPWMIGMGGIGAGAGALNDTAVGGGLLGLGGALGANVLARGYMTNPNTRSVRFKRAERRLRSGAGLSTRELPAGALPGTLIWWAGVTRILLGKLHECWL